MVDNSTSKYFPKIGRQIYGSCVPFHIIGYQFSYEYGRKHLSEWAAPWKFSPAWGYNLLNDGKRVAIVPPRVYDLMKFGVAPLATFPYDWNYRRCPQIGTIRDALNYKLKTLHTIEVKYNITKAIKEMEEVLDKGHVLTFATFIRSWKFRYMRDKKESICYKQDINKRGGHFVTVVGYDENLGAFKIANSWGPAWKNKGFVWVSYDAFKSGATQSPIVATYQAFWIEV